MVFFQYLADTYCFR